MFNHGAQSKNQEDENFQLNIRVLSNKYALDVGQLLRSYNGVDIAIIRGEGENEIREAITTWAYHHEIEDIAFVFVKSTGIWRCARKVVGDDAQIKVEMIEVSVQSPFYEILNKIPRNYLDNATKKMLQTLLKKHVLFEGYIPPYQQILEDISSLESLGKKNAYLFIGITGHGKSLTIARLMGAQVIVEEKEEDTKPRFFPKNAEKYPKVNHTTGSGTSYPDVFPAEEKDTLYVDCPGFEDTRSHAINVWSSLAMKKIANKANGISGVVVVIDYECITGKAREFRALVDILAKTFSQRSYLTNSIYFIFTKVPDKKNMKAINAAIEALRKEIESKLARNKAYQMLSSAASSVFGFFGFGASKDFNAAGQPEIADQDKDELEKLGLQKEILELMRPTRNVVLVRAESQIDFNIKLDAWKKNIHPQNALFIHDRIEGRWKLFLVKNLKGDLVEHTITRDSPFFSTIDSLSLDEVNVEPTATARVKKDLQNVLLRIYPQDNVGFIQMNSSEETRQKIKESLKKLEPIAAEQVKDITRKYVNNIAFKNFMMEVSDNFIRLSEQTAHLQSLIEITKEKLGQEENEEKMCNDSLDIIAQKKSVAETNKDMKKIKSDEIDIILKRLPAESTEQSNNQKEEKTPEQEIKDSNEALKLERSKLRQRPSELEEVDTLSANEECPWYRFWGNTKILTGVYNTPYDAALEDKKVGAFSERTEYSREAGKHVFSIKYESGYNNSNASVHIMYKRKNKPAIVARLKEIKKERKNNRERLLAIQAIVSDKARLAILRQELDDLEGKTRIPENEESQLKMKQKLHNKAAAKLREELQSTQERLRRCNESYQSNSLFYQTAADMLAVADELSNEITQKFLNGFVATSEKRNQKAASSASSEMNKGEKKSSNDKEEKNDLAGALAPQPTRGGGDCAFHAAFGQLEKGSNMYVCEDHATQRKVVAEAIRIAADGSRLFLLRQDAIKALIMEGRSIGMGKEICNVIAQYQAYVVENAAAVDVAWGEFERLAANSLLKECIADWFSKQSVEIQARHNTFKSKFYACLVAHDSLLRGIILATDTLRTAFERYNSETSRNFAWDRILNEASIINEYAEFLSTPGNYLLPIELDMIANALNITIHFYTRNFNRNQITEVVTYNPGQKQSVKVCFNGNDHYERMTEQEGLAPQLKPKQEESKKTASEELEESKSALVIKILEPFRRNSSEENCTAVLKWLLNDDKNIQYANTSNKETWLHFLAKIPFYPSLKNLVQEVAKKLVLEIPVSARTSDGLTAIQLIPSAAQDHYDLLSIYRPNTLSSDYVGAETQIEEISNFLDRVNRSPNSKQHFLLLSGPSGVGKTELTNKVCEQKKFKVVVFNRGAEDDKYVGQLESRVQALFIQAKQSKECTCIFIDEMDSVTPNYQGSPANGQYNPDQIVTLFQIEISNLVGTRVIVIGATNYLAKMKPAMLDRATKIHFNLPNVIDRKKIIEDYLRLHKLEDSSITTRLSEATSGWSPRLIAQYLDNVLKGVKEGEKVTNQQFEKAFESSRQSFMAMYREDLKGKDVIQPPSLKVSSTGSAVMGFGDFIREQLQGICLFLNDPKPYIARGITQRNLLLYGPAGTGKTEFAKAVAKESNAMFISIDGGSYKYPGTEFTLRKLFEIAKNFEKAVIFIDEIDAMAAEHSPARETLQTEMEGFLMHQKALVIIGATNFPSSMANPILSRFGKPVEVKLPDEQQRSVLFTKFILSRKEQGILFGKGLRDDSEIVESSDHFARQTSGFSIRDIKNLIDSAVLLITNLEMANKSQGNKKPILFTSDQVLTAIGEYRDANKIKEQPDSGSAEKKKDDAEVDAHAVSSAGGAPPLSLVAKSLSKMFAGGDLSGAASSPKAANVAVVADPSAAAASPAKKT